MRPSLMLWSRLAILKALGGCHAVPEDTGVGPWDTAGAGDCSEDPALLGDLSWDLTDVQAVVEVRWTLVEPAPSRVWFQATDAEAGAWTATATRPPDGEGRALLVGVPFATGLRFRVVAGEGEDLRCSPLQEALTGEEPADLPHLAITPEGGSPSLEGFLLVGENDPGGDWWAVVLDGRGRYVWAWKGTNSMERLRLAVDGEHLLMVRHAKPDAGVVAGIVSVGLDGVEGATLPFTDPAIDFTVLADGTLAVLVDEVREFEHDGQVVAVLGQALDVRTPDGTTRRLWSVFDVMTPDFSEPYPIVTTMNGAVAADWAHVNGVSHDPQGNLYYVTAGGLDAVFGVDATTGATRWTLADEVGDWTVEEGTPLVQLPHSAEVVGVDRLLIFNRYDDPEACSDATEIALDPATGSASRVWTGLPADCTHVEFLGNALRLPDGSTLVSWSSTGRIDALRADSSSGLRLDLPLGSSFGFVEWLPTLYPASEGD